MQSIVKNPYRPYRGGIARCRGRPSGTGDGEHDVLTEQSSAMPAAASCPVAPVVWTAEHVRCIGPAEGNVAPLISERDFARVDGGLDIWDAWPVQDLDGHPARIADGISLWMALAAPHFSDPDARHQQARIHLLERRASRWRLLGPVMPDGFSPGSREWSGSAVLAADRVSLTLYFTA